MAEAAQASTGKKAVRACFVHSLSLNEVEIRPDAVAVVGADGAIESIVDVTEGLDLQQLVQGLEYHDYSGKLIIPGLVDCHCHAPQYIFSGTGMDLPLLQWLEKYTFPSEARFFDSDFAKHAYEKSVRRHLKNGTTLCAYFATIHLEATKILADVVNRTGQRAFIGKVNMDRNSPDFYKEQTTQSIEDTEKFIRYVLQQTSLGREALERVDASADKFNAVYTQLMAAAGGPLNDNAAKRLAAGSPQRSPSLEAIPEGGAEDSTTTATSSSTTPTTDESTSPGVDSSAKPFFDLSQSEIQHFHASCGVDLLNRPDTPRVLPVITPRFVPTCSDPMMHHLGVLSHRYGVPVQSHLSETVAEIAWVKSLHPEYEMYADVYKHHGMLHERTIMAHCTHAGAAERRLLKETGTGVVHCPSSNFNLGSGVLNVRRMLNEGQKIGLGTDVAGGYSASLLDTIRQTILASRVSSMGVLAHAETDDPVQELGGNRAEELYPSLSYKEAFYLATVGGAQVLGMDKVVGNFLVGKKFDALVVDVDVDDSPIDTFDYDDASARFQKFLYLGDDRNILHVFVDGRQVL